MDVFQLFSVLEIFLLNNEKIPVDCTQNASFQIMSLNDENYTLGSEYLVDILFWVKQHERRPSLRYKKLSPQIEKRGQLIEWSKDVSQKLGLSDSTFHLAIRLIDLFMDGHDIMVRNNCDTEIESLFFMFLGSSVVFGCLGRIIVGSKDGGKRWKHSQVYQIKQFREKLFPNQRFLLN